MSFFFFQAEDGIRDKLVTGVQTCALPIFKPETCCRRLFSPGSVTVVSDICPTIQGLNTFLDFQFRCVCRIISWDAKTSAMSQLLSASKQQNRMDEPCSTTRGRRRRKP